MRKLTWLLGAMLLLLSLTGCGNKVDSESIRSYLESSYYNESDASVDEIKDISQEQGIHRKLYGKGEQPLRRTDGQLGHNL